MSQAILTRRAVASRALPIMGANVAAPLVGLVDLAVIGHAGNASAIAAVALGTLVFNMFYWSLGFLRMGATALTAQADGAARPGAVRTVLYRALILAGLLGALMIVVQWPLREGALALFSAGPDVAADTRAYIDARIWGAPAALAGFAVYGWLIGLGLTGRALVLQIVLNLANAALSVWFVFGLDWGVAGVAGASALAQWLHLALAGVIIWAVLRARGRAAPERVLDRDGLIRLFAVNRDLFIRTLALLAGFYWFNEASLREGADVLAGNAILLQYISICAFILDAFAHVAEAETGRAAGARDWTRLKRAFRLTSEFAFAGSLVMCAAFLIWGEAFVMAMTTDPAARAAAAGYIIACALVPLVGWPSWQLDGLMIGTTRGPVMRNAMIAALAIYLALDLILRPAFGVTGLWAAFLAYYAARAGTLAFGLPGLKRAVTGKTG
ncbi:MATE family efflux transporter [Alkalicaulis satelles]|uniref:MATE family efflux transporter n=1 Tax=Alkalicaulis satelles TaxID=2609175 RepID=A0A5M6ZBP3_9PROT|nr:MATE family efflux transporter [Alkalicaulis satelles]KAA5802166.1 MATE family efflux transporter [Alkalicaulis satelles]